MVRRRSEIPVSRAACLVTMGCFIVALVALAMRLKSVQVDGAANYNLEKDRQCIRRVQTAGFRGSILDARGRVLAGNRVSQAIVCHPELFQRRTWEGTVSAISGACERVAAAIGRATPLNEGAMRRHVNRELSLPLVVWNELSDAELARFMENASEFPGFEVMENEVRIYPDGPLVAHVIGYVGRESGEAASGDMRFNFSEREMRGRAGLEYFYDSYLRGVSGEDQLKVDARGFTTASREVTPPRRGPDLVVTLDRDIQLAARRQLSGLRGACVVLDAKTGGVLAMVSAPDYDLNAMVPTLDRELYARLKGDTGKPLLNRAVGGSYAPGSTFKPITALAGLGAGISADVKYCCSGAFEIGGMHVRCSRRWGHGDRNLTEALRDSCNPFFCNLGCQAGTNRICRTAKCFGLGTRTGIDLPDEVGGVVPDGEWKTRVYGERWYPGDLAQISIGQGMLLVTPLQMSVVAAALGTGRLVSPRLRADMPVKSRRLPFPDGDLETVRTGMRMVVSAGGTGVKGAEGVQAKVILGKTGTAEVGKGATRRKNTWFIAYAEGEDGRAVAVAMVIENGVSGGGTTAPKVAAVLRAIFNGEDGA